MPAVRHAVLEDEHVVVSTATLALQRQIITRDLPLVATASSRTSRARRRSRCSRAGTTTSACTRSRAGTRRTTRRTLFDLGEHAGAAEHPAPARRAPPGRPRALGEQVLRLREWADETDTGDRDDLVPGVTDRAWRQVSVTSLECLGGKCPMLAECFPEKAEAASREADVVVTNHAMLGIAASGSPGVLPEHQVLVVDEAHELTDRVTAQATSELSVATIEHAARLARRHGGVPTTDLDSASQALATVLVGLPEARFRDGLPPAARDAVASVRDAAARAAQRAQARDRPERAARGRPQDGAGDHARAVRGGRPDGRRPRRQPAHRPVVLAQRGPARHAC